jgi:hypothetical protein
MKWLTFVLLISTVFGQTRLPDNPPSPVRLPAWRRSLAGHPSRLGFWTAHAGLLGATVYDEEITHAGLAHHKCTETNPDLPAHPTRGQLYRNGLLTDAVLTGIDYLLYKKIAHGSQFIGAAYGVEVHVRGGTGWLTEGCW